MDPSHRLLIGAPDSDGTMENSQPRENDRGAVRESLQDLIANWCNFLLQRMLINQLIVCYLKQGLVATQNSNSYAVVGKPLRAGHG